MLTANNVDREPISLEREMTGTPAPSSSEDDGPVRPQRWEQRWPIASGTARLARLHTQTRLAMAAWAGDPTVALRVATELVQNAVDHVGAGDVLLVLLLDETEHLIVEVADEGPEFTAFEHAIAAQKQTGLGLVRALGGNVALESPPAGFGKTVRVVLHPLAARYGSAPFLPVLRPCSARDS
ncbi:ATP-binding protein [Streptomyces variabilis]